MNDLDKRIIEEANYYLDNDVSLTETANHFGYKSKKTIQLHFEKLSVIDPNLVYLINEKKSLNMKFGQIKGGHNGKGVSRISPNHKEHTLTKEEASEISKEMVRRNMTIRETAMEYGIPKSTLYDNLKEDRIGEKNYKDLTDIYEGHKMK